MTLRAGRPGGPLPTLGWGLAGDRSPVGNGRLKPKRAVAGVRAWRDGGR